VGSTLLVYSELTPDSFSRAAYASIEKLSARSKISFSLFTLTHNARKQTPVLRTSDKRSLLPAYTSFAMVSTSLPLSLWDKCIYQGETVMCALRNSCRCPSYLGHEISITGYGMRCFSSLPCCVAEAMSVNYSEYNHYEQSRRAATAFPTSTRMD